MPTISEPTWRFKEGRTKAIVNDFINGIDTEEVFRARLYGNGLRGQEITLLVHDAQHTKMAEKYLKLGPRLVTVLVLERGGVSSTFRFNNADSAGHAVKLLRKLPNVIFANRVIG